MPMFVFVGTPQEQQKIAKIPNPNPEWDNMRKMVQKWSNDMLNKGKFLITNLSILLPSRTGTSISKGPGGRFPVIGEGQIVEY